jgi:hypothetical protein
MYVTNVSVEKVLSLLVMFVKKKLRIFIMCVTKLLGLHSLLWWCEMTLQCEVCLVSTTQVYYVLEANNVREGESAVHGYWICACV